MNKLVVLASGSGTNFQSIIDAVNSGEIRNSVLSGLITNNPRAGAIKRAQKESIPVFILPDSHSGPDESGLFEILKELQPDLIILAGYLKKIPDSVIDQWTNKIINIHPALLPKFGGKGFYGMHVHRAVIESGDKESGCTIHYVNEVYDDGEIIAQEKVPVLPDDTPESLASRVLSAEHRLYPKTIQKLLNQKSDRGT